MLLLAGLGNPGERYAHHRHNVGFMAVDEIHTRQGFGPWRIKFHSNVAEGRLGSEKCLLQKPMTYMNNSGAAVSEAARFYKIDPEHIVVIHDELDLPPGKMRTKSGGGIAGHNGLKSIGQHIGRDFRRVRIGIGHPGDKDRVHRYVLQDFAKADDEWVASLVAAIAENAPLLAKGDDSTFMNKVHLATAPDEPPSDAEDKS